MSRVRARREKVRRFDWPLPVEAEMDRGVDLGAYITKLGRLMARHATTAADLARARGFEEELRYLYDPLLERR